MKRENVEDKRVNTGKKREEKMRKKYRKGKRWKGKNDRQIYS